MKETKKYIHSDSLYLEDPNEKRKEKIRQYNKEYYQKRKLKTKEVK